jgi:hypothetical protein
MNTQLSKDKIMQLILGAVVIVLAVVVIVLVKREPQIPFVLNQENGVKLDENALPAEEGDKAVTDTGAKTTTTTKTTTASDSGITTPPPVSGSCKPGLSGKKVVNPSGISLYWNPCSSDDFQFYKLVKSSTNPNPSYPNDPVVMSSSNHNVANYLDKTVVSQKTYYYSLCVIQRLGKVACSNKIAVAY